MKRHTLFFSFLVAGIGAFAQCPPIIQCSGNIVVGTDPGQCSAVVNYFAPQGVDTCVSGTQTFNYTGSVQMWVVPAGVISIDVTAWGAEGGSAAGPGGLGGQAQVTAPVNPGDTLWIYVGGKGNDGNAAGNGLGGFNGGGDGYQLSGTDGGSGGGGGTDVRRVGNTLNDRFIVAGGGGGSENTGGGPMAGGAGGGLVGGDGQIWAGDTAKGGTQTAGGAANTGLSCSGTIIFATPGTFGQGGAGGRCTTTRCGGGGGGGWYGGGGVTRGNGSGGGSGYVAAPGNTNTSMSSGVRSGDGMVTISYQGAAVTTNLTAGLGTGATFPLGTTTETYVTSNSNGTDSCSFTVTVVDSGQATVLATFSQDTICTSQGTIALPVGTPAGGNYTGTGVVGSNFDPAVAQIGTHWIYYTDTVGCQNTDSTAITVVWCTGIQENTLKGIVDISPNPSNGLFNFQLPTGTNFDGIEVMSIVGKRVLEIGPSGSSLVLDLTGHPNGTYLVKVRVDGKFEIFRLLKQ